MTTPQNDVPSPPYPCPLPPQYRTRPFAELPTQYQVRVLRTLGRDPYVPPPPPPIEE